MTSVQDEECQLDEGDFKKDQDLWFEDGNIVIIANKTHAFRVYRGLLSRVSSIVQFMINELKPDAKMDGDPVLHFFDSPTDVRHFLHTVMLAGTSSLRQHSLPFATIASIIRIAHKYEAQEVLDAAASRLESFLVPRPGHWLESTAPWDERFDLGQQQCGISFEPTDAVAAINIAQLLGRPLMLPVALFLCCLVDAVRLRRGVPRLGESSTLDELDDAEYERCILAIQRLILTCRTSVLRALDVSRAAGQPMHCRLGGECRKRMREMFDAYAMYDGPCRLDDAFVRLDRRAVPPAAVMERKDGLCGPCWDRLLARSEEECDAMRRALPGYFSLSGLEGWPR